MLRKSLPIIALLGLAPSGCWFSENNRLGAPCEEDAACPSPLVCDEAQGICVDAAAVTDTDESDTSNMTMEGESGSGSMSAGDGDGDGDGDPTSTSGDGDGDGDPTSTSGDGDGDGDPTSTSGDGDGDVCGDGVVGLTEVCDGAELVGETCISQGFTDGTLACAPDCQSFDTSNCTTCGDGLVEGAEQCDPNGVFQCAAPFNLGDQVCNNCILDQSSCSTCGDDVIEGTEICDGDNVGTEDCQSAGFLAGTLSCDASCLGLDTSGCTNCGDGVVDSDEECDGTSDCTAACQCDINQGFTACPGAEFGESSCVEILDNNLNCGACNLACPSTLACTNGQCTAAKAITEFDVPMNQPNEPDVGIDAAGNAAICVGNTNIDAFERVQFTQYRRATEALDTLTTFISAPDASAEACDVDVRENGNANAVWIETLANSNTDVGITLNHNLDSGSTWGDIGWTVMPSGTSDPGLETGPALTNAPRGPKVQSESFIVDTTIDASAFWIERFAGSMGSNNERRVNYVIAPQPASQFILDPSVGEPAGVSRVRFERNDDGFGAVARDETTLNLLPVAYETTLNLMDPNGGLSDPQVICTGADANAEFDIEVRDADAVVYWACERTGMNGTTLRWGRGTPTTGVLEVSTIATDTGLPKVVMTPNVSAGGPGAGNAELAGVIYIDPAQGNVAYEIQSLSTASVFGGFLPLGTGNVAVDAALSQDGHLYIVSTYDLGGAYSSSLYVFEWTGNFFSQVFSQNFGGSSLAVLRPSIAVNASGDAVAAIPVQSATAEYLKVLVYN